MRPHYCFGRITGISGILGGVLFRFNPGVAWRMFFIIGLLGGAIIYSVATGAVIQISEQASPALTVLAGLLVGFGTRLGSGCTSGHAICGIARISKRSFIATAVFMITAFITVYLSRHVLGWSV